MNKQIMLTLEDCDLADIRGGDGFPMGSFLSPSSSGFFFNENENTNRATAISSILGPIFL